MKFYTAHVHAQHKLMPYNKLTDVDNSSLIPAVLNPMKVDAVTNIQRIPAPAAKFCSPITSASTVYLKLNNSLV